MRLFLYFSFQVQGIEGLVSLEGFRYVCGSFYRNAISYILKTEMTESLLVCGWRTSEVESKELCVVSDGRADRRARVKVNRAL